jgi:hypothetical protein
LDWSLLNNETIRKTIEQIAKMREDGLEKAVVDLGTGLTGYNLEAPAKLLVPILSPFRSTIPRRTIPGIGTNWRSITAITPSGIFKAADGERSNSWAITKADKSTTYGPYGRLGTVTREGQIAGGNFEDVRARVEGLTLLQFLQEEEAVIIGGFTGTAFDAGPTPTVAGVASGGSLADDTYYVSIVELTMEGAIRASRIARPDVTGANGYDFSTVPTLNTGSGCGTASTEANGVVTGGGGAGSLTVSWTPNPNAVAYAVYIGLATGTTNHKLQGIVTQASIIVKDFNTTGAAPPTTDTSDDAPFSGMIEQLNASGSGAYIKAVSGTLGSVVGRGIAEIDAAFNDIYDRVKSEPDRMVMGWPEFEKIDNALSSVTNDRVKLNIQLSGGASPGAELPRFTTYKTPRGKVVPMEENPNIPGGMILFLSDSVPIPDSEIPNAWEMHMGSDLARLDYALTKPTYEFEDRGFGALAGYATGFQGYIYDIREA